jgi:C4-dicarboxylate-specific signal transduction histidine kinase
VREILASQGRLDRVEHHWHVDPAVPDLVIDPARLEQVLVNLILNALDALKDGVRPAIEVVVGVESVEHLQRWERREGDPPGVNYAHRRRVGVGRRSFDPLAGAPEVVVISVSDNGPGLPAGDEERVFDPFFTTKAPGEGTGLGLSICAQLVESMGGRIQAANRPEGGACFTVRLTGAARAERELRIEEARQVER